MCTRYAIINRVSELKVHIELTRFVQPEKIEIDANERAVNEKSQYCFFVCTTFDSFLNDLFASYYSRSSLLVANSVLCCLRTASPQGIGTQASQGSVAPLAERDSETFSIMFAVHLGLFPSAFDILPDTDPDRPC